MHVGYKFRLYPNKEQEEHINKTLGCCRFVYNHYLAEKIKAHKEDKKNLSHNQCSADLTKFKQNKEVEWLNEVARNALNNSLEDLNMAFQNFFRSNNKHGYPKFKCKNQSLQSYKLDWAQKRPGVAPSIEIKGNKIKLPKLGLVKFARSQDMIGHIVNATISKTASGKYFVGLCVDTPKEPLPQTDEIIGIDLGIKDYLTDSNGNKIHNPKTLYKLEHKLTKLKRNLSRKQKGSKNRLKAKRKLAKLHEHIRNQRQDFLHKLSTKIINENQIIVLEDLNVKGMLQNHKVSKSVQDVSWYQFKEMLDYKSKWYNRQVIYIDRFFPSSQLCSACGYQNHETKNLSIREWDCPECGEHHDRDVNAAINILREGLKQIA
jgi:putative transposase